MTLHLRYAAVILALCVSVFVWAPKPANATPMTYDFTSGPLTGWFTYDSDLATNNFSDWDFTDGIGTYTTGGFLTNNVDRLVSNASFPLPAPFVVGLGDLNLTTVKPDYAWLGQYADDVDNFTVLSGQGSYVQRAVPEPTTFLLLALGLLALLGYEWRQRRQAGMQVG